MTTPAATPLAVVVVAVQFTPDRTPGLVQFMAQSGTGILGSPQQYHPTQDDWAALAPAELRAAAPGYWSDAEIKAHLQQYLAAQGIAAVIVENVDPPQPDEPVAKTTLDAAPQDAVANPVAG